MDTKKIIRKLLDFANRKRGLAERVHDVRHKIGRSGPVGSPHVLNLKPFFYRKHRIWFAAGVVVLAVVSVLAYRSAFTRAEVADFYPATCLGTWQYPENAQGEPSSFDLASSSFNGTNSAILDKADGEIFCGKFLPPDFSGGGNIKNVGLTLVWNIQGLESLTTDNAAPAEEFIPLPAASSTNDNSTNTEEPSRPVSFGWPFLKYAFAEETSTIPLIDNSIPSLDTANSTTDSGVSPEIVPIAPDVPAQTPAETTEKIEIELSSSTDEAPGTSSGTPEFIVPEPISIAPIPPDENFLKVSYSLDGQGWIELAKVSPDTWNNFTITLPNLSWGDLARIQISIKNIPTTIRKEPKIFLDGMLLEVHHDVPPIFSGEAVKEIVNPSEVLDSSKKESVTPFINLAPEKRPKSVDPDGRSDFNLNESPQFDFDLDNLPTSTFSINGTQGLAPPKSGGMSLANAEKPLRSMPEGDVAKGSKKNLISFFLDFFRFDNSARAENGLLIAGKLLNANNPTVAKITDWENKDVNVQPFLLTVNNKLRISLPEQDRKFRPGRYHLKLWLLKDGIVYITETDFTWGVLAVNFNKSVFNLKDQVEASFGVLDDRGHTICDAGLSMKVISPTGKLSVFSTANGDITRNKSCGPENITQDPDYSATFKVREKGIYSVEVLATTKNGERAVKDQFLVENSADFSVERAGPTRIYPVATYKMSILVTPKEDFAGEVKETVPASFDLITETQSKEITAGDTKEIVWNLNIKKGETKELTYFFDPPDVSPELFKLGPLEIKSDASAQTNFKEGRSWQLASDAAGQVILMWEGAIIPDGWTCISCAGSDPFFDVFPRASSTYGSASSSANTSKHDLTGASDGGANSSNSAIAGVLAVDVGHTHVWPNVSSTANDIRPLYRGLKFIQAATTTIPNGAIGMFDVSSSSLPASWSYYSAIENRYLVGTSTVGNAGTSTHTHALANDVTSDTSGSNTSGGTAVGLKSSSCSSAHSHTFGAASSSLTVANNNPPYIGIVFGQTTATTTLGSGSTGLIAMFDNASLPSNWSQVSTSGSAYVGKLILGSSTFGVTGGSSTHNHGGGQNFTSDNGNCVGLTQTRNGGVNFPVGASHTHTITYSISAESTMPIYRDVILGKFTPAAANTVVNVVLNNGNAITLVGNATTTVSVAASTTGSNFSYATGTIYRSSATATCAADNLNCYQIPSSSCLFSGPSSSTVRCSADIYYFAQATDASSSYASNTWMGQISLTDTTPTSVSSSTATGVELNTLMAINLSTSSINYGSIAPSSTTGLANQIVSVHDVGNASTSIQVSGTALTFGANVIATSSQHYASSTFNFGGGEGVLSNTATTISGLIINPHVSLVNDLGAWGTTTALPGSGGLWMDGVVVAANGYMYLIGGDIGGNNGTSSVHYATIDASTGTLSTWTKTQSLASTTARLAAFAYNGRLYELGGATQVSPSVTVTSSVNYATLNSNGTIGSWTPTTALPVGRTQHQAFAYNGYAYVLGGTDSGGTATSSAIYAPIASNGTIGSWLPTTDLPNTLIRFAAVVNKGIVYVIGGAPPGLNATSSVWYAPINSNGTIGTWLVGTATPGGLSRHVGFVNGDYIYTSGGIDDSGSSTSTVFYAPINANGNVGTWVNATTLPAASQRLQGAAYNGYAYSLGGSVSVVSRYTQINNGNSQKDTFWGAGPPGGAPTGTYSGVNTFTAVWSP